MPCLQTFPEHTHLDAQPSPPAESNIIQSHVELLTHPSRIDDLRRRSAIIQGIRGFFQSRDFLEVNTPILAGAAGGAIARAFETTASEFPDRKVSLRIAPELWLKRLIVGGLEKIFEIGPSFRNEGMAPFDMNETSLEPLHSLT